MRHPRIIIATPALAPLTTTSPPSTTPAGNIPGY